MIRFHGISKTGDFNDALNNALASAKEAFPKILFTWELEKVVGDENGGIKISINADLKIKELSITSRPNFKKLKEKYTKDKHKCKDVKEDDNQCAIRVSRAMKEIGISIDSSIYPGKLCEDKLARGAQDLGGYLEKIWGKRDLGWEKPGNVPGEIKDKTGIILFANIPDYNGQGHIDLWDKIATMTGEYWNANPIWFWNVS